METIDWLRFILSHFRKQPRPYIDAVALLKDISEGCRARAHDTDYVFGAATNRAFSPPELHFHQRVNPTKEQGAD